MQREGTLHIVWLNRNRIDPVYSVGFADYASSGGAMKLKTVNGSHELIGFLSKNIRVHADIVNSALKGLQEEGNASIFNVILSDDQLYSLGLK